MTLPGDAKIVPLLFEPADVVMIRAPLLPIETVQRCIVDQPRGMAATASARDHHTAERRPLTVPTTREWLHHQFSDPVVQEALLAGSSDLFHAILRWERGDDGKKSRRTQTNLFRYLTRMASRPTPFGLFAGVAVGNIGPEMNVRLASPIRHGKRTRPDMQWLLNLVREIEQRPNVRAHVRFFANTVAFISGGRLYVPHLDTYGQVEEEKAASLRATPVVRRTLALAREGATLASLEEQLVAEHPDATSKQVQSLLDALCQHGALLSDLRPPLTGDESVRFVLEKIADIPGCDDLREQLRTVHHLAATYDAQPLGQGIATLQELYKTTKAAGDDIHSTLQIDMRISAEAQTVSTAVAQEIARAAEIMLRVASVPAHFRHLSAYRDEFLARYGEAREVPLLELLDDDIGLGPPPSYQHPPRAREYPITPATQPATREATLVELATAALATKQREIVLDERTLGRLQVLDDWRESAPDSLEVYASIAAHSQAAIADGEYAVVIGSRIGAVPAGRSFGRFADILGQDATRLLMRIAREEEARHPDKIYAELVYLPPNGHAANVALRPAVRHHEIVVAATPGIARDDVVPVDDLVVGVRSDRFYLRSQARGIEVVVRTTHLLNYATAPNVCRFLDEVSAEESSRVAPFDWGPAGALPFLPRVRSGRVVLCPAEWRLPSELFEMSMSPPTNTPWHDRLQQWRHTWHVPQWVYLTENDNRLLLDMENPLCVADLAEECGGRDPIQRPIRLQEMLPEFGDIWAKGAGGHYLVEFVVPLVRRRQTEDVRENTRSTRSPARGGITPIDRLRLPGSDWLYAKLYAGRTRHEDLLAGPVRELANRMVSNEMAERWFFIRYADPEAHLRLRFAGEPARLLTGILPCLTAWSQSLTEAGLIRKMVIDSYEREIERYGGLDGMALAERIFAIDSVAIADILALRLRRALDLTPIDIAILTIDDLLKNLGGTVPERLLVYRAGRQWEATTSEHRTARLQKKFHSYRTTAQRLIGDRTWLQEQAGGAALQAILLQRAIALHAIGEDLRSLIAQGALARDRTTLFVSYAHMHCNRLLGLNRALENETLYYLERTLESLQRYVPSGVTLE